MGTIEDARLSLSAKRYKWATIQGYYALFHGARTLLYSRGYKERSHYCAVVGIEHLFGKEGLLDMKWIRALQHAMSMREDADYADEYSKEGAETTINTAEAFLEGGGKDNWHSLDNLSPRRLLAAFVCASL